MTVIELNQRALEAAVKLDFRVSKQLLLEALEVDSGNLDSLYLLSRVSLSLREYPSAIHYADELIRHKPKMVDALLNKGFALVELRRLEEALRCYALAEQISPDRVEITLNRLNVMTELGQTREAFEGTERLIEKYPRNPSLLNTHSALLAHFGRFQESISTARAALFHEPRLDKSHVNIGNSFLALRRPDSATVAFNQALRLNPHNYEAVLGSAKVLAQDSRFADALNLLEKFSDMNPRASRVWFYRGLILAEELSKFPEALECFETALQLEPYLEFGIGWLISTRLKICDWYGYQAAVDTLLSSVNEARNVVLPFHSLLLFDDPKVLQRASQIYFNSKLAVMGGINLLGRQDSGMGQGRKKKLRLGYFSPDFNDHPVSRLIIEVLEAHSRDEFEVCLFYSHPTLKDHFTDRWLALPFEFFFVGGMSDDELLALAMSKNLDIAIDLGGYTKNSRTRVFCHPIAKKKINYLGFPGTMGADVYDYIIADSVVLTEDAEEFFNEKTFRISGCYQPNSRLTGEDLEAFAIRARTSFDTPLRFCCFNAINRVSPQAALLWARVLSTIENSTLALLEDNSTAESNLKRFFADFGVDPDRIVFVERMVYAAHLDRQKDFDLFLDTSPYNAHTTASDALRRGLPVATLIGKSFQSRVAASLLTELGVPELICATEEEFISLCVRFSSDASFRELLHTKLENGAINSSLYKPLEKITQLESFFKNIN